MSKIFKASLIMTIFFAINKVVALVRQYLITKQYGLTADIDAFNVSNNLPDLLFSLIAGSAVALAIVPVLTEYFDKDGKEEAWLLFSRITNLVFIATAVLALIVAVAAEPLIMSQLGIAPGFSHPQQVLTVHLMRLNLVATLVFSISGLIMSGLHAKKHFLFPAIAPILFNVGQIIGVTLITPFFHNGVYGLAYGVILGSLLHVAIQIPVLIHYKFKWHLSFGFHDLGVQRVLKLMGPRILTVLFIQIIFLTRDNLASRLQEGTVSALTYGYYILQVPETLIGTALGTALLPTLSQFAEQKNKKAFSEVLNKTIRVMVSLTIIISVIAMVSLSPFITVLFHFKKNQTDLLVWVTNAYIIGLCAQCLLEVTTRAFYAEQDAKNPFWFTFARMVVFILLGLVFFKPFGAVGLALADTITVTLVVCYSLYLLRKQIPQILFMNGTFARTVIASTVAALVIYVCSAILPLPLLLRTFCGVIIGGSLAFWIVKKELQMLIKL